MQRLVYLRIGTPRLYRVFNSNNYESKDTNRNILLLKRCLSSNNKNENDLDINTGLYKPSTDKKETPVSNDLKGGQSKETFDTQSKSTAQVTSGGKIWSVQNPGSVHVAPLNAAASAGFVHTPHGDGKTSHETTVHTMQGELNLADPFKTHTLQSEPTPGQLAEAEAASAFEVFAPDTPLATPTSTDTVFAPKISSNDVFSPSSSPTGQFENAVSSHLDTTKYETSTKSQVFGGQDTSASSKKHPNEITYNMNKPNRSHEIPIQRESGIHEIPIQRESGIHEIPIQRESGIHEIPVHRESDIRDDILRESLKYINEKGWTMEAIRAGVHATNQPTTVEGLFSNGYDLVEYFMRDANAKMSTYMNEKAKKGEVQGNRLLIDGLKYRIGLVIPYAKTWDQALAQGALPQNAARGWKNLLDLSSDAWHGIGDTSTDISWYSKRLLLAAVYKSAEIFMLQDQSQDKIDTMNFLERRLNDFQTFGSFRNTVSKSLSDTAQIASGLFSVVRNLTSRR